MIVFITGVGGFLGCELALHLAARGDTVRGSFRSPLSSALPAGIETHRHRLGEPVDSSLFAGVEVLVHCAHDFRRGTAEATTRGTLDLMRAASAGGVRRQVFVSSLAARPDAVTEYGRTKYALESRFLEAGHPVVRPGTILGWGGLFARIARTVLEKPVAPLVDGGRGRMMVIGAPDLCRAMEAVVRGTEAGVYNLYLPEAVTMREVLGLLAEVRGHRVRFATVPSSLLIVALRTAEKLGIRLPVDSDNLRGYRMSQTGIGPSRLPELVPDYRSLRETLAASFARSPDMLDGR